MRPPISLPWSTVAPLVGVALLAVSFALPIVLVGCAIAQVLP